MAHTIIKSSLSVEMVEWRKTPVSEVEQAVNSVRKEHILYINSRHRSVSNLMYVTRYILQPGKCSNRKKPLNAYEAIAI